MVKKQDKQTINLKDDYLLHLWIVLECLWDLYFTELAIYLAHLLLHQGLSWLTALATYGFIYLSFLE